MDERLDVLGFRDSSISNIARLEKNISLVEEELLNNISGLKELLKIGFKQFLLNQQ